MAEDNKQNGLRKRQNKGKPKDSTIIADESKITSDDKKINTKKINGDTVKRKLSDSSKLVEEYDNRPLSYKIVLAIVWLLSLVTRLYKIQYPALIW